MALWPKLDDAQASPEARAVFHCVQIGPEASEVLAGLAERTGGTFLRVRD